MGRVSQRHRLDVVGLDSSGRAPQPGTNYIAPTRTLTIVTTPGTDTQPGVISVEGVGYTALMTLNASLTPSGEAQENFTPTAPAGNAFDAAETLATSINGSANFTASAVGARIEIFTTTAIGSFTIDSVSIT